MTSTPLYHEVKIKCGVKFNLLLVLPMIATVTLASYHMAIASTKVIQGFGRTPPEHNNPSPGAKSF